MFTIACICTGNVCRSPVAERLLAARLGPDIRIMSGGTEAPVGSDMSPMMATLLRDRGVDAGGFTAHSVTTAMLRDADLLLPMTRAHRAQVVEWWPAAVRRAYTLTEFARLVSAIDPGQLNQQDLSDRLRTATRLAAAQRGYIPSSVADDIEDPLGQSRPVHESAFSQIAAAVDVICAAVGAEAVAAPVG